MKKIFNYIGLCFLGAYAALPFIPTFYYHFDTMVYDPSLDKYVPHQSDSFYSSFENFYGQFPNPALAVIGWVVLYLLIGATAFFFVKDFKNEKRRKWVLFIVTTLYMLFFMVMSYAPRGA